MEDNDLIEGGAQNSNYHVIARKREFFGIAENFRRSTGGAVCQLRPFLSKIQMAMRKWGNLSRRLGPGLAFHREPDLDASLISPIVSNFTDGTQ